MLRTRNARIRAVLVSGALAVGGIGVLPAHADNLDDQALAIAEQHIGDPEQSGAAGPNAFDCSGLTQYSFAQAGRSIPRTAQEQYDGSVHKSQSAKEPGDLIFFTDGGSVYHVGIYAGGNDMIAVSSAAGSVQREAIYSSSYLVGTY